MTKDDKLTAVFVNPRTREVSFTMGCFVRLRGPSRLRPHRDDRFLARVLVPHAGEQEIDLYLSDEGTTWVLGHGSDRLSELRAGWTLSAP